jgi:hypothetical protein
MVRLSGQGALKRGFSPSFKKKSPLLGEGPGERDIRFRVY